MKKFAVAFISFHENELVIEIVEAHNWMTAIMQHSKLKDYEFPGPEITWTIETIRGWFDTVDAAIDVKEIT